MGCLAERLAECLLASYSRFHVAVINPMTEASATAFEQMSTSSAVNRIPSNMIAVGRRVAMNLSNGASLCESGAVALMLVLAGCLRRDWQRYVQPEPVTCDRLSQHEKKLEYHERDRTRH